MPDKKAETPKNIHQRILAVMAEINYVSKENKKVNNQYTFVSHDAVTAKMHPQFVKHGIVVIPSVTSWGNNGNRTEAELTVSFINVDEPSDKIEVQSFGYGIDPQDKGPGKAVSYAYKYALLKLFALETGDDPEKDLVDHKPDEKPDWRAPARHLKDSIDNASSQDDLNAVATDEAWITVKKYATTATKNALDAAFDARTEALKEEA